jgi:LuxR family maltose regulon positive regulatory protein
MLAKVQTPLLQTKLLVPPLLTDLVPRQHLIDLLVAGQRRKFTLVSAPPGFGKTTLVSSWIHQMGEGGALDEGSGELHSASLDLAHSRVAWVSLDEHDNDPARFWEYVIAALLKLNLAIGEGLPSNLGAAQSPSLEAILTVLINNLAALQPSIDGLFPLVLVLEDYHLITNDAIHEGLNFLIDHQPPSLHIVMTTRSDPPLQLSLRQGRSEITQIRASDLSFSGDEAAEFLNSVMGLDLSEMDVSALKGRTEGWIAGLHLAALSLRDQEDRHAFVNHFAGDDRYIADYLVDEVLRLQPPEIQTFLLQTSILEQLCAPLCDAVTHRSHGQAMLSQLERANLFLTSLDNRREWFRFHPLFADLLRRRLAESNSKADIADLHQRASRWYAEQGDAIGSIDHALNAREYREAAQLIERQAQEIFSQFRLNTLSTWIQALPQDFVDNRPLLSMIHAWALLATGKFEEVDLCLRSIESSVNARAVTVASQDWRSLDPKIRGALVEVTVVRSVVAITEFKLNAALELCQKVLPYLEDNSQPHLFNEPLSLRTVVVFTQGLAYKHNGEIALAEEALSEAARLSLEQKNINILPAAMAHLAQLQVLQGQLHQAEQTYQRAIRLASEFSDWPSPLAAAAEIGLGHLYYEWNELDRSLPHFKAGLALAERWNNAESLSAGYIGLAKHKQAQGDGAAALTLIEELSRLLGKLEATMLLPDVERCRARLWIIQGKLTEAVGWLQASGLSTDGELEYLQEPNYLILIRILLAQERWEEAAGLIDRLLDFAEEGMRYGRRVELLMLRALALDGQGKTTEAQEVLSRSLTQAGPEGYVRLFADEGSRMAPLLYRVAADSAHSNYIDRILGAIDLDAIAQPSAAEAQLVEPLSDREIEVLECISEGLSNREIAQRLTIALSTVKSHTRNIYSKMGVNSRTQAIAHARAWGILTAS